MTVIVLYGNNLFKICRLILKKDKPISTRAFSKEYFVEFFVDASEVLRK